MEIISLPFALLAIASIFLFYLVKDKYRISYLTLLSCGFIAGFNYYLLVYIIIYSFCNYYIGLKIPVSRFKKTLFRTGIIVNISQLIVFKYASFAIDPIFQIFNFNLHISKLSEIIVPLGISFFTLQGIGYLINIKMGWEKPENKFLNFLLYIIFYPKFLSGPIERSNHFLPQLKLIKSFNEQNVAEGLRIALFGFFKKIVIANQLGNIINPVYSNLDSFGGFSLWIIILIQPLYLYFDFSGYTDIAVGFAKAYGIELLPNFNRPFLSENVTSFWRRMHMSLSLWFNDYVFKQVSYKYRRWGKYSSVFAVFVAFTLFGIWHGAGWNFMVLGFVQAMAINYEFFTKKKRVAIFSKMPDFYRIWAGRIFTYLFFGTSLVFFFSPDIKTAFCYYSKLNHFAIATKMDVFNKLFFLALICSSVLMIIEVLSNDSRTNYIIFKKYWINHKLFRMIVYYMVIFLIITQLGGNVSFIYQMF
jgi:alginate O-acetyltransferase complex protein AlgI